MCSKYRFWTLSMIRCSRCHRPVLRKKLAPETWSTSGFLRPGVFVLTRKLSWIVTVSWMTT
jgi:hypothetical protein